MNNFDPGPGWREIDPDEAPDGERILHVSADADHRRWVREVPPPPTVTHNNLEPGLAAPVVADRRPARDAEGRASSSHGADKAMISLPTTPYTVMRVGGVGGIAVMDSKGTWRNIGSGNIAHNERITGFEVLSEPRAVTAKAVLDYIAGLHVGTSDWDEFEGAIAHEFGVES